MLKNKFYTYGGGSLEMELSKRLLNNDKIDKNISKCYSNALESLVETISNNCNLNTKEIMKELKLIHSLKKEENELNSNSRFGIDILNNKIEDMKKLKIFEPSMIKKNIFLLSTESVCNILEIDFVIIMPQEESEKEKNKKTENELKKRKYAQKKWKEFQNSLQKNL